MTFVKTFESFRSTSLTEAVDKANITKISPEAGELARWKVVLKSGSDSISNEAPIQSIIDSLVMNGDFKNWWTTTKFDGSPASMTLGIVYSGVMNKTNLVGKEVAKAEIAFVAYRRQHTGESAGVDKPAADVFYDVTKADPIATATVSGSKIPLAVWHQEKLIDIKLAQPVPARDKSGKLIEIDKVYPSYMKSEGQSATDKPTTTDTTTSAPTTSNQATSLPQASQGSQSNSTVFVDLKKATGFNQTVQDLQKKIMAKGGDAAAALGKFGADGKYGSGTANAIGKLVNNGTPVDAINAEISAKLDAAFKDLTQAQIDAANTKKADTPTVVKPKAKITPDPGFF
jgi:hypothetical protein